MPQKEHKTLKKLSKYHKITTKTLQSPNNPPQLPLQFKFRTNGNVVMRLKISRNQRRPLFKRKHFPISHHAHVGIFPLVT